MTEKAYAKINLTLDIVGKRLDGYHLLESVMQSVSLFDTVEVEKSDNISVSCSEESIPLDRRNTCFKAAHEFFYYVKINGGAKINICKHIPQEAGLGGGSSDAAAVIRALNELYRTWLRLDELILIAQKVGADVPFCIVGGTAICRGVGESVVSLENLPKKYLLLVKPEEGISTPDAYRRFDIGGFESSRATKTFVEAVKRKDDPFRFISNDLEKTVGKDWLRDIKRKMLDNGACAAQMSGSGSTVFGVFDDKTTAEKAAEQFRKYPFVKVCKTI